MKIVLGALLSLLVLAQPVLAGTISKQSKSFGGTSFINGVVPQASDFNGDMDTIYGEFNGNIDNANIKTAAAIAATKISPDGFTTNVRTIHSQPCTILEESDQGADLKRWAMCVVGGELRLSTHSDAGATQNDWFKLTRANGGFVLGGSAGTNTINGTTTFNQTVTFTGGTSLTPTGMVTMYMGTSAPAGWLLMEGGSNSCTGASSANANLCAQLIGLFASVNYKGSAAATFTVDTASDEIIHTAHGKSVGDRVHFSSTTTLPAPLSAATVYCIESITTDRFKISTTCGGVDTDITDAGSGTHSDYFNFLAPDVRGRVPLGTGTATTTENGVDADVDITANELVVPTNNVKWITGTQVTFTLSSGTVTGLTSGNTYYVIRMSTTRISLASSLANAQNGVEIDFTAKSSPVWTITNTMTARTIGEIGGEQEHAMSSTELLAHTHDAGSGVNAANGSFFNSRLNGVGGNPTSSTGGNAAMNIMNPFLVMTYIIKL